MENKFRKGIFVVIYKIDNNKSIDYLLLKRKLHWKGWEFSKGGIEKGETKMQTVKREVREESGINPVKGKIKKYNLKGKYFYDKNTIKDRCCEGQTYELFSAQIKKGKIKIDKKEHSDYKWVDFRKAIKMLKWKNQKRALGVVDKSLV